MNNSDKYGRRMDKQSNGTRDDIGYGLSGEPAKSDIVLAKFDLYYPQKETVTMYGSEIYSESIYRKLYRVKHSLYATKNEVAEAIKIYDRRRTTGIIASTLLAAITGFSLGCCGIDSPIFWGVLGSTVLSISTTLSITEKLGVCHKLLDSTNDDIENAKFVENMVCDDNLTM